MGGAILTTVSLLGKEFNATLSLDMQEQAIEASVTGTVEDDNVKGDFILPEAPPMPFTGTRQAE